LQNQPPERAREVPVKINEVPDEPTEETLDQRLDRLDDEICETDYDVQDLEFATRMLSDNLNNAHDRIDELAAILIRIVEDPTILGNADVRGELLEMIETPRPEGTGQPEVDGV
jgi:hypothetical protein